MPGAWRRRGWLVEMQTAVAAPEVEQRIETWFERRLLHFPDQNKMVAAVVDRMMGAFEHRQRIHQHGHAMLAQGPWRATEAILDPGRESDRGWLLPGLEHIDREM